MTCVQRVIDWLETVPASDSSILRWKREVMAKLEEAKVSHRQEIVNAFDAGRETMEEEVSDDLGETIRLAQVPIYNNAEQYYTIVYDKQKTV